MKKKVFITIIFFAIFFLIFYLIFNYKSLKNGNNNIRIKNEEDVNDYILNISNYEAKIEVIVKSNKNENKYIINQKCMNNYSYQEMEYENNKKIIIEHKDNKVIIRNTSLKLEKIYESWEFLIENNLFLTTFVENFKETDEKEILVNENYYVVNLKLKKISDKNVAYKSLYINKNNGKIEKLEIYDINKNRTIYILYKEITINE